MFVVLNWLINYKSNSYSVEVFEQQYIQSLYPWNSNAAIQLQIKILYVYLSKLKHFTHYSLFLVSNQSSSLKYVSLSKQVYVQLT